MVGFRLAPAVDPRAFGIAACAHGPRPRTTFEEAGLLAVVDTSGAPMPPPVKVVAPRSIAGRAGRGPAHRRHLLRFAAEARARRAALRARAGFPEEAANAWLALAADLDLYLSARLPQTPLLELVAPESPVETEWDLDLRRYGPASPELAAEVTFAARRPVRDPHRGGPRAREGALREAEARQAPLAGRGRRPLLDLRDAERSPSTASGGCTTGSTSAAEAGRVVWAAARGYVVRAGGPGLRLLVESSDTRATSPPANSTSPRPVRPGDAIEPGQALGLVGATGRATGPHLHFEVWRGGKAKDPLALLGDAPAARGTAGGRLLNRPDRRHR